MKKLLSIFVATLGLSAGFSAAAQNLQDAQGDLERGQYQEALIKLDNHLSKQPRDAEARFLRGLSLVMLQRDADAIQSFADLARDFPELPEPYNNLAVLYARNGEYEKARDALETALIAHPSYATAHENLGDIYTALASAAYNRSLVLDKANQSLRIKLDLLSQLGNLQDNGAAASIVSNQTLAAAVQNSQPQATTKATPLAKPRPTSVAVSTAPVLSAPAPVAVRTQTKPQPQVATANADAASLAALKAVEIWRAAWSSQDIDAYLGSYSPNFQPARGIERSAWEAQRRRRLNRPKAINIQALNPEAIKRANGRISVRFVQIYESNTYSDQVQKQVDLELVGSVWKIVKETVLN